jgi:hypothetical protein
VEFFAIDRSSGDGLQSWCRRCKAEWEQGPSGVWCRLRSLLAEKEPASLLPPNGWSEELYMMRWEECAGRCEECGAGLGEWQIAGHRLDRIDNRTPHIPANCAMLCWPCNRRKADRNPETVKHETTDLIRRYGRGRIPWQVVLSPSWRVQRAELPDPTPFFVPDPQLDLFPEGDA